MNHSLRWCNSNATYFSFAKQRKVKDGKIRRRVSLEPSEPASGEVPPVGEPLTDLAWLCHGSPTSPATLSVTTSSVGELLGLPGWHFHIPSEADARHQPDDVIAGVELPPAEPVAGRSWKSMMRIVPSLSER